MPGKATVSLSAKLSDLPAVRGHAVAQSRVRQRLGRFRAALRALGMGQLQLTATMPSGHTGTLMPQRMYFIDDSQATLDGTDLGRPAHLQNNPTIGEVTLPARGVLATRQAAWKILDPAEYQRTRYQTATAAQPSNGMSTTMNGDDHAPG